ncbi:MAG: hypothetical protein RBJ76_26980 [Stenomitos frigidus ULC029]
MPFQPAIAASFNKASRLTPTAIEETVRTGINLEISFEQQLLCILHPSSLILHPLSFCHTSRSRNRSMFWENEKERQ